MKNYLSDDSFYTESYKGFTIIVDKFKNKYTGEVTYQAIDSRFWYKCLSDRIEVVLTQIKQNIDNEKV